MARTIDCRPMEFSFNSFATGHHVYQERWVPVIGEALVCEREPNNQHDQYAVALKKNGETVGHVPRNLSRPCYYGLLAGGKMYGRVIGERGNTRQNGLDVPITYTIKGPRATVVAYVNASND